MAADGSGAGASVLVPTASGGNVKLRVLVPPAVSEDSGSSRSTRIPARRRRARRVTRREPSGVGDAIAKMAAGAPEGDVTGEKVEGVKFPEVSAEPTIPSLDGSVQDARVPVSREKKTERKSPEPCCAVWCARRGRRRGRARSHAEARGWMLGCDVKCCGVWMLGCCEKRVPLWICAAPPQTGDGRPCAECRAWAFGPRTASVWWVVGLCLFGSLELLGLREVAWSLLYYRYSLLLLCAFISWVTAVGSRFLMHTVEAAGWTGWGKRSCRRGTARCCLVACGCGGGEGGCVGRRPVRGARVLVTAIQPLKSLTDAHNAEASVSVARSGWGPCGCCQPVAGVLPAHRPSFLSPGTRLQATDVLCSPFYQFARCCPSLSAIFSCCSTCSTPLNTNSRFSIFPTGRQPRDAQRGRIEADPASTWGGRTPRQKSTDRPSQEMRQFDRRRLRSAGASSAVVIDPDDVSALCCPLPPASSSSSSSSHHHRRRAHEHVVPCWCCFPSESGDGGLQIRVLAGPGGELQENGIRGRRPRSPGICCCDGPIGSSDAAKIAMLQTVALLFFIPAIPVIPAANVVLLLASLAPLTQLAAALRPEGDLWAVGTGKSEEGDKEWVLQRERSTRPLCCCCSKDPCAVNSHSSIFPRVAIVFARHGGWNAAAALLSLLGVAAAVAPELSASLHPSDETKHNEECGYWTSVAANGDAFAIAGIVLLSFIAPWVLARAAVAVRRAGIRRDNQGLQRSTTAGPQAPVRAAAGRMAAVAPPPQRRPVLEPEPPVEPTETEIQLSSCRLLFIVLISPIASLLVLDPPSHHHSHHTSTSSAVEDASTAGGNGAGASVLEALGYELKSCALCIVAGFHGDCGGAGLWLVVLALGAFGARYLFARWHRGDGSDAPADTPKLPPELRSMGSSPTNQQGGGKGGGDGDGGGGGDGEGKGDGGGKGGGDGDGSRGKRKRQREREGLCGGPSSEDPTDLSGLIPVVRTIVAFAAVAALDLHRGGVWEEKFASSTDTAPIGLSGPCPQLAPFSYLRIAGLVLVCFALVISSCRPMVGEDAMPALGGQEEALEVEFGGDVASPGARTRWTQKSASPVASPSTHQATPPTPLPIPPFTPAATPRGATLLEMETPLPPHVSHLHPSTFPDSILANPPHSF